MHTPNPRKRVLLPLDANAPSSSSLNKRSRLSQPAGGSVNARSEIGRLHGRSASGSRVLLIELDKPFTIGRSTGCDYVLDEPSVSGKHCRLYSITADTGETLVMLQDTSTNGTMHNGRVVKRGRTVVLSEGDRIEIGKQLFRYSHTAKSASAAPPGAGSASASTSVFNGTSTLVGDFLVSSRTLGSGAFSQVFLAMSTKTLKQVACKRLPRSRVKGDRLEKIQREVEMLKKARHPNINKIEDVVVGEEAVSIFLQLVSGGDLFSYLLKRGRLDAPESKFILYQLFLGLQHLHDEVNVAHRDIKLENIILATGGPFPKVQLADFGQSRSASQEFRSLNGTLQYMAPEQLMAWTRKGGYSGKKADMWSVGIVLALLLTGAHPFEPWSSSGNSSSTTSSSSSTIVPSFSTARALKQKRDDKLVRKFGETAAHEIRHNPSDKPICEGVVKGEVVLPSTVFGSDNDAARSLLSHLLSHDPSTRATASQALLSRWIKGSKVQLEELYSRVVEA
ncbi:hypothetical protein JCM8547_004399 [Rhodosporidiobolus lusitaniae]